MRTFLTIALPLLGPTVLYFMWAKWESGRRAPGDGPVRGIGDAPWAWLALAGTVLAVASVLVFDRFTDKDVGSVYQPAHVEDGKLIPGRMVAPPKSDNPPQGGSGAAPGAATVVQPKGASKP